MKNIRRSILAIVAFAISVSTASVQAGDYLYETNHGTINITHYIGPGGNVTIPSKINELPVTSIAERAFSGCYLLSLTIPNSVTNIGNRAFAVCSSLTSITVDTDNAVYSSANGVLLDKSQTSLIQCPGGRAGSYMIPNSVTSIGDYAFDGCSKLNRITIPNSVTTIGDHAFYYCTNLTDIIISESVTMIGDWAFDDCFSLTSVTIPKGVTSIGFGSFLNCTGLTSITIPNSVTSIRDYAFQGCSALTSVTIPNSVTSVGDCAFRYCFSLTGIIFPTASPALGTGRSLNPIV